MTDIPSAAGSVAPTASPPPAPNATPIVNTPTLVMGPSGSGKSSLLATLMEWGWEHYRAISFYYSFDGGGFPTQVQALINRGICRLWRVQTRGSAEVPGTIQRAAEGWWPARINPLTGECPPNVVLLPPVTTVYLMRCPNGHPMRTSRAKEALTPGPCPVCGTLVTGMNMRVETTSERTKGLPEHRLCLYDGLTGAQDWYMEDIAKRNLGGEKGAIDSFISDGVMIATASRAKIGSAQSQAQAWVKASANIPSLVVPAVWTALTQEASEEGGLTVIGPSMAGNAKTPLAPAWFGSTIEASVVRVNNKQFRRISFHQFMDDRGRRHLCRVGAYPGAFEPFWEEEEDAGVPFRTFNLGFVHQRLADARKSTEAQYDTRYPEAPGLPTGEQTYGGGDPAPVGAEISAHVPPAQGARVAGLPPLAPVATRTTPVSPPGGAQPGPVVSAAASGAPAAVGNRPAGAPGTAKVAPKPATASPVAAAPPVTSPTTATPSAAATGPLPPATVGPPKAPVAGPAPPPGRRPA